ncbi:MAG: type III pantothenate kinase [Pseudonocardiaceae bacterium]
MLLAIDAGNSHTVVGIYQGAELADQWRLATNPDRTSDEHFGLLAQFLARRGWSPDDLSGLVISSTVPRLTAVLRSMADRYFTFRPVVLEPGTRSRMAILYDDPRQVGPDRIANAVAAFDLYGGPTIVVDFGTATTVDATSARREYLGGAVLPGVEVSLDALFVRAAALSWVELVPPQRVIGKSTAESVQSGVLYGFAAAVDGLCRRFQAELGPCTVVSTGGLGELIAPLSECIGQHEPWLTLHGLRIIHQMNS